MQLIADLRDQGNSIAVIALGSHAVFRTAIDIARMDATDFLERPLSERECCRRFSERGIGNDGGSRVVVPAASARAASQ